MTVLNCSCSLPTNALHKFYLLTYLQINYKTIFIMPLIQRRPTNLIIHDTSASAVAIKSNAEL